MLLIQVLEADSDDPPYFRTFLVILVMSVNINNALVVIKQAGDIMKPDNLIVHLETGDEAVDAAVAATREIFTRKFGDLEHKLEGKVYLD